MNLFRNTFLAVTVSFVGMSVSAQADILLAWNFSAALGSETSYVATTSASGVTVDAFTDRGVLNIQPGISAAGAPTYAGSFGPDSWNDSGNPVYLQWTIAADTPFTVSSVDFYMNSEGASPESYSLYSDLGGDGFSTELTTYFSPGTDGISFFEGENLGFAFENLSGPVTFRLVGNGADISGHAGLSNGSSNSLIINSVPEPSTYALLLLGLAGMGLIVRAKKRQAQLTPVKA